MIVGGSQGTIVDTNGVGYFPCDMLRIPVGNVQRMHSVVFDSDGHIKCGQIPHYHNKVESPIALVGGRISLNLQGSIYSRFMLPSEVT
ncbi:hypothetical protein TNCV_2616721 [Trichonephila clavipes]|nr:hypothetical protein TNCV_2616721 [Trichonephila clavipes]